MLTMRRGSQGGNAPQGCCLLELCRAHLFQACACAHARTHALHTQCVRARFWKLGRLLTDFAALSLTPPLQKKTRDHHRLEDLQVCLLGSVGLYCCARAHGILARHTHSTRKNTGHAKKPWAPCARRSSGSRAPCARRRRPRAARRAYSRRRQSWAPFCFGCCVCVWGGRCVCEYVCVARRIFGGRRIIAWRRVARCAAVPPPHTH